MSGINSSQPQRAEYAEVGDLPGVWLGPVGVADRPEYPGAGEVRGAEANRVVALCICFGDARCTAPVCAADVRTLFALAMWWG